MQEIFELFCKFLVRERVGTEVTEENALSEDAEDREIGWLFPAICCINLPGVSL